MSKGPKKNGDGHNGRTISRAAAKGGAHASRFLVEALEPRLLLSADLNVAAGHAVIDGLAGVDQLLANLSASTALSASAPFINRSLGELAALGDPLARIEQAAGAYLTGNGVASITGLASALQKVEGVTATASVSGNLDSISLTLSRTATTQLVFDLSATGDGHALSGLTGQTLNESQTQTLALNFGVDVATGAFQLNKAALGSNTELRSASLSGAATFDGARVNLASGDVDIVANVAARIAAPAGGALSLSELATLPTAQIATTSVGGHAFLEGTVTSGTPVAAEYISDSVPDLAHPDVQVFDPASVLAGEVNAVFNDLTQEVGQIQALVTKAESAVANLPFIGSGLGKDIDGLNIFDPILKEIGSLQATVNGDLASTTTLLSKVKSDIIAGLSSAGLLPGTAANDVTIWYKTSGGQVSSDTGSGINLSTVTQLELDLNLGMNVSDSFAVDTQFGLPGLGLSISSGSKIAADVNWTLDVGLGMDSANGGSAYLVSGANGSDASPLNLNLSLYLANGFQAAGKMGLLNLLLSEPTLNALSGGQPDIQDHTGVFGKIGLALTDASGGQALNSGLKIAAGDISSLGVTPNYSLTTQANLNLQFGVFQSNGSGGYDTPAKSQFPSLAADLKLAPWSLSGTTFDSVSNPSSFPDVALDNVTLQLGSAITSILQPILAPIYDATNGMSDVIQFLQNTVPIVGNIVEGAASFGIPASIIAKIFPSYSAGDTYDWVHFGADMLYFEGDLTADQENLMVPVAEAAFKIVLQIDKLYDAVNGAGSSLELGVNLGSLDFGSSIDMFKAQKAVTNASQLASLGDVMPNMSSLSDLSTSAEGLVGSYLQKFGAASGTVSSILGTVNSIVSGITSAADAIQSIVAGVAGDQGDPKVTTKSVADVSLPLLEDPSSLIGLLFGQNVQFIHADLGFEADFSFNTPIAEVDLFGIIQAILGIDIKAEASFGLQIAYDSTGLIELINNPSTDITQAFSDGLKFGPNPLLAGTPQSLDVLYLSAKFGAYLNGQLLEGLATAGLEGGVGLSFEAKLIGATAGNPFVNLKTITDTIQGYKDAGLYSEANGFVGPLQLKAGGFAYLDFVYKSFWGFGPSGDIPITTLNIFKYPSADIDQGDLGPLALYNPTNGDVLLYVGALTSQRNVYDAQGGEQPVKTGSSLDNASGPNDVANAQSADYTITLNADGTTDITWTDPKTGFTEDQHIAGEVKDLIGNTGAGNDQIKVVSNRSNNVQVDLTGGSGESSTAGAPTVNNGANATKGVKADDADIGPLGYYESGTGALTLYTGAQALDRDNGADATLGIGPTTYYVAINANNFATITWTNPKTGKTETQKPDGPIHVLIADTSNGDQIVVTKDPNSNTKLNVGNTPASKPTGGSDTLYAAGGDAVLKAGGGDNILHGGPGNDLLVGGGGATTIYSGGGNDTISGGTGPNLIFAGAGNQSITGGPGNDTVIAGGPGNSTIDGGAGVNTLDYSGVTSGVNANLTSGVATGAAIGAQQISNFSILIGPALASTLVGGTATQGGVSIYGGSGGDSIVAGGGNDFIQDTVTGAGNFIDGSSGNDTIASGAGADTIVAGDGNSVIATGDGNDSVSVGNGKNSITGGNGKATILAGNGANTILAGVGDYSMTVGDGANSIVGSHGNNTIHAGAGANSIYGGVGDAIIIAGLGGTGANTIHGGTGNDQIFAGDGANSIYGGTGNDSITAGAGANSIIGGNGDDTIVAGNGNNTVYGGVAPHGDFITVGTGSNSIDGGVGNDSIVAGAIGSGASSSIGGTGANSIIGGTGNDTIRAGNGGNTIFGGTGNDLIVVGNGANTLLGGTGQMTIFAGNGQNSIVGGNGNDSITAGDGNNIIWGNNSVYGGTGNDTITVGNGQNTVYGGTGNNEIFAGNGNNIIFGGLGSDTIQTGTGNNTITGGTGGNLITVAGGQNVIDAGDGANTIQGGAGSDIIRAGKGANKVTAGSGKEFFALGDGSNTVYGGAGPDNISVGDGNNFVYGGTGDDTIVAGAGTNVIFGGAGNNFISDGAGHAIIQGGGGNNLIYGGGLGSTILGGAGNDTIYGGGGGNLIVGGSGKVTVYGGAGGDAVYGALGDSELHSGGGATQIFGDHAGLTFALTALGALTRGVAAPNSGPTNQRATIFGGSGADSLYGGVGSDTLYGGTGTRFIKGGGAASYIQAGPGAGVIVQAGDGGDVIIGSDGGGDSITGGAGADRIELRGGNNFATGGGGANVIVGSTGNDKLVGSSGQDTLVGGAASDILQDTSVNQTDTLVANSGETGDSLSSPSVVPATAKVALPSDSVAGGWWSPILGTAGVQLGPNASTPVVAAGANGPWLAWTQTNAGGQGLYVAQDVNGTWTAFGGSDAGLGLGLAGTAASNPSITLVNGAPVVAWTATSAAGSAIMVATYNTGSNSWVSLAGSDAGGGISGIGAYDQARVVATSSGPVVTWRDSSGAQPALDALQFNGTNWVKLGASLSIAGTAGVGKDYAAAASGGAIALAFSLPATNGFKLNVLQFGAGAWAALPTPNAAVANGPDASDSQSPTLAYAGGNLYIAWAQKDVTTSYDSALYAEVWSGGVWSAAGAASGLGLTNIGETVATPVLATNGAALTLAWTSTLQTANGEIDALRAANWNGTSFVAAQASDIAGTGIGLLSGVPTSLSLALDASGRATLAYQNNADMGVFVRAGAASAAHVFVANATTSIASLLASGNVHAGDLILVTATTTDGALTLGVSAAGVTLAGVDGAVFNGSIAIQGATGVTLRNLIVTGAVSVTNTDKVTLAEERLTNVTLSGATNVLLRGNALQSLTVATASGGQIYANTIAGAATALTLSAAFTGLIHDNDMSASGTVVLYNAAAALANNRIHGGAVGVSTTIADSATLFGAVAGSTPNTIAGNAIGVQLNNAQVINQIITANTTGVSGSGLIGGTSAALYNVISYNGTGVANFTGLVQFNRIDDNATGIAATTGMNITSNQLVANTQYAILVSGVSRVQIAGNTVHSTIGDAIHLQNAAKDVAIVSNIIWTDSGTGIYVANDSQTGFWSDYNDLYATGAGTIVYWTKFFTDILDWRDDVATYDLHSIGVTSVNPGYAEPHFGVDQYGFLVTRPPVAGLQATDPTLDAGDPAGSFYGFNGVANLLANGGFAAGLTGWIATAGGSTVTAPLTPWNGAADYQSGSTNTTNLQQTVSLLQNSVTAAQIDSGSVQVAFGGQVAVASASVTAQISVLFLDADGNAIGKAVVVPATGAGASAWTRVFDTVTAPSGARSVEYLFNVARTDASVGGWLDNAYLAVIPRGVGQDLGVRTAPDVLPGNSTLGRIQLQSPEYYLNWVANAPMFITWDAYGAASGQPVSIQLWQDGANGPRYLSTITASTADTGLYAWSPSASGILPGTAGLRIRISSVAHPAVFDMSQEAFAVPQVGSQFYVAPAANGGSNRNTGTSANSALPNPDNLFRAYAIGAGAVVNIAAGDYPLIAPLNLSGAVDLGFGLDSGFTIQGATNGVVNLHQANPLITPQALIHLSNASFVTLNNLTLTGAVDGLLVDGGSNNFNASYLTATGQTYAGFAIITNSPAATLDHLTANNNGQYGLAFSGNIAAIANFVQSGDQDGLNATGTIGAITFASISNDGEGIVATGSIAEITDNTFAYNSSWGLDINLSSGSTIEGNHFLANGGGATISGNNITFGDATLSDGRGNILSGNTGTGVHADGAIAVVGNQIGGAPGETGISLQYSAQALDNYVFGGLTGISSYDGGAIRGNRIFDNTGDGVDSSSPNTVISDNVIYSNAVGIRVEASAQTISNNLVYADSQTGLLLEASGSATVSNNTFYEPTAGVGPGNAVIVDDSPTLVLTDNIIEALTGVGIAVTDRAQAGFTSNYNLFDTPAGVGVWLGVDRTSLSAWRAATGRDSQSLYGDPQFVSPNGGAAVSGYLSTTQDGGADDFHVQTPNGDIHGGALAVSLNASTHLLNIPSGVLTTTDKPTSPAIDAGDPSTPIGAEPAPNGGIVEIGAYGGTAQASLSPAAFLAITSPNGGENLFQGATATITWNTFNVSGLVDLSASSDGVHFTPIATGVADSGSYAWTVNAATFPAASTYVLRIQSEAAPAIADVSNAAFIIAAPVHTYYVNASATGGDFTTAGGNDSNSGFDAAHPMASLGALLAKYNLGAGDTVYVDAGTYKQTQNIVFGANDSGVAANPVTIIGDGTRTIFDRHSNSDGFYDIEIKGAQYITFETLVLTGAQWQFYVDSGSGAKGIELDTVTVDMTVSPTSQSGNSGVYVGAGNDGFTVLNSTFKAPGYDGLDLDGPTNSTVIGSSFIGGWSTGVGMGNTTGTTLRADTFVGDNTAVGTSWDNNLTLDSLSVSGGYYGISVYHANGVVENNTIHDTLAFGLSVGNYNGALSVSGDTIYNIGGNNSYAAALTISGSTTDTGDIVHDSYNGVVISNSAVLTGATIYNNTNTGLDVEGGAVSGGFIHDNGVGVYINTSVTFANNVLVDNATGLVVHAGSPRIVNNTIVQASGDAVNIPASTYNFANWDFRDNILSLGGKATGLDIPASGQSGFAGDYNLYQLSPGATPVKWSGVAYDLADWQDIFGFDAHSLVGDPLFVDPAHGNYTLKSGSPAIDAGDPSLSYANEPAPNGGRINIGSTGDTSQATTSANPLVQITGPDSATKVSVGDTLDLTFSTTGFINDAAFDPANATPLLAINAGGGAVTGGDGLNFAAGSPYAAQVANTGGTSATIESLIPSAAQPPLSLFQSFDYSNNGVGQFISYAFPKLADGEYAITLYFADPGVNTGRHILNIDVNGQLASGALLNGSQPISAAGIEPYVLAGDQYDTAISITILAQATGGRGLTLAIVSEEANNGAFLNGLAIAKISTPAALTATVSVSTDGGATYAPIATNVPVDPLTGEGQLPWTVDRTGNALFQVSVNGVASAPASIQLAPAGNIYYVNNGALTAADIYTTAAGNDSNDGKTPGTPMQSLQALLRDYQLKPGDTVYLDAGTYALPADLVLGANIAGTAAAPIRIIGAGDATILARAGNASGTQAILINGAHDLDIENLAITGGANAINIADYSGSSDIQLVGLDISAFGNWYNSGVYVGYGASNISITNSKIHDSVGNSYGVLLQIDNNVVISNDTILGGLDAVADNANTNGSNRYGASLTVSGGTFLNQSADGVYVFSVTNAVVSGNTIKNSGYAGIELWYSGATATGNSVSGGANDGILLRGGTTALNNEVFGTKYGIDSDGGSSASGNLLHDNVYGLVDGGTLQGNTIYDNQYGADLWASGSFSNNLLYGNTLVGILSDGGGNITQAITSNTIVQSLGSALRLTSNSGAFSIQNNIFAVNGGADAYEVNLNNEPNFSSDWNDFFLSGAATFGTWGGIAVASYVAWRFETSWDQDSGQFDPAFVDPTHNNFHLAAGSPAIDGGNPSSAFSLEPGANGGRINLGYDGDTAAAAAQSAAQTVQVLSPDGLNKLEVGTPATITFRTSGIVDPTSYELANSTAVLLSNENGPAVSSAAGVFAATNYATHRDGQGTNPSTTPFESLIPDAAQPPQSLFNSFDWSNSSQGDNLTYSVPVADGVYALTLYFADPGEGTLGNHSFDLLVNGQSPGGAVLDYSTVISSSGIDPQALAGGRPNTAIAITVEATASGGKGFTFSLHESKSTTYGPFLNGFAVSTLPAKAPTATVSVSTDNGASWSVVGTHAPIGPNGAGSLTWTPTQESNGNTALVKVTVGQGASAVSGVSAQPFLIANGGNTFYVNDGSTVGDVFTTAVGNDLNSGKSADAPVSSIRALLNSYTLGAGDIVYVDSGTYTLLGDLVFDASNGGSGDSAAQRLIITGADAAGGTTIINRANTTSDASAFNFAGADYVTVENLEITGGVSGVREHSGSTSIGLTFDNDIIFGNAYDGMHIESNNSNTFDFVVENSRISGSSNDGLEFDSVKGVTLTGDNLFGNGTGIYSINGSETVIENNTAHNNTNGGINVSDSSDANPQGMLIESNQVFDNAGFGLSVNGVDAIAESNYIYGQTGSGAIGLIVVGGATGAGNVITGNATGVLAYDNSIVSGNRIFANTADGVDLNSNSSAHVTGNRIYSNLIGISAGFSGGAGVKIDDNLIYLNANGGVSLSGGSGLSIVSNTFYQPQSSDIAIGGGANAVTIEDNILWSDLGDLLNVASNSLANLVVDYNLYYRGANTAASVALLGTTTYASLAQWQAADATRNVSSREGNPNFIKIAGADQVLGGADTALGGGADDDFTPGANSPAIDAANSALAPKLDLLGQDRHDDPATANAGTGSIAYADIGAIEFQGASNDVTPPLVTGSVNLPAEGATTDAVFSTVTLDFNKPLDLISATDPANYQLVAAGPDGKFGTSDDLSYALTPAYSASAETVTLTIAAGALPNGAYRLTVSPSVGLLDASGNELNGAGTGAGTPFIRDFTIDRSAIQAPVVANQTLTTPNNASLAVALGASDPQGLALSYAISQAPTHGQITNFDAAKGTFTYVPALGYVGADVIKVTATDAKLAQSTATITINDTKVVQPPIAAPTSAQAIAGQATIITVTGSDVQTPVNQLVLSIVSQPAHGVATITGQNTISYTANAGYSGGDSFTFAWTDTGNPAGSLNPGVTSAPATVSLSVITLNQAPGTAAATISANENTPYVFQTSDFPYSDARNVPPTAFKALIVESLPALGALTDNGAAVQIGQAVAAADIAAGKLIYMPAAGGFGAAYASFKFAVENSGGTANGAVDISGSAVATVNVAATPVTVTLAASNTPIVGASLQLTATLGGGNAPTGSVDFKLGSTDLGSAQVSNGVAVLSTAVLPVGSDQITATYSGDANNASQAANPLTVIVGQATPSVALAASPTATVSGQSVTLTATLSGGDQPSGSVDFKLGSADLGSAQVINGVATLSTAALPVGLDQIAATYSGDVNNVGVAAQPAGVTVAPTVSIALGASALTLAQPATVVTFTFSGAPSDFSLSAVTATGGALSHLTGSGLTYTATLTAAPGVLIANAAVSVAANAYHANGVAGAGATSSPFVVDTAAPSVASVSAGSAALLGLGAQLDIVVSLSAAVGVSGGAPTLSLNNGGLAPYSAQASAALGGASLVFVYTVGAKQDTSGLAVAGLNANGATIADAYGNAADLTGLAGTLAPSIGVTTANPAVINAAQALQAEAGALRLELPAGTKLVVVDTAQALAHLSTQALSALATLGVTLVQASDAAPAFTKAQLGALGGAGVSLNQLGGALTQTFYASGVVKSAVYTLSGTILGQAYSSYEFDYAATGSRTQQIYHNASGRTVVAETFQANGGYAITINGAPYQIKTVNAKGGSDIRSYAVGTIWGQAYASYDITYSSTGARTGETWSNKQGKIVAAESFVANGGYSITVNGALYQVKTVASDLSFSIRTYTSGIHDGQVYASVIVNYSSAGVALSATYYTRGGAVIARLEAGEDDQPDLLQAALTPAEGVAAAEPATASPVIPAARQRAAPAPAQERLAALMFGAPSARTSPKPEIEAMFGGEAAIHALEAALLLGLAPIARGTLKQRGKSPVPSRSQMALYDMAQDRFEGADEAPEPIDLPLSTHSDQGAVDWIVME